MAVPNPFKPNEEAEQFVIEQFNELIPRFREEHENYVDYARAAQELADANLGYISTVGIGLHFNRR